MATRSALITEIASNLPDNTVGSITPALVRTTLTDIINSVPTLTDLDTFATSAKTFSVPPTFTTLTGILQGNGGSAITALAVGQLPGTALNDSANAGNIGEFITATGTTVSLTTATPANITSISLTAGDWDVFGVVQFNPAGTTTQTLVTAGSNSTSATLPTAPAGGLSTIAATQTTGVGSSLVVGTERYSLSVTTTVYLVASATFATSTMTATGKLSARRAR